MTSAPYLREDVTHVATRGPEAIERLLERLVLSAPDAVIGVEPGELVRRVAATDACVIARVDDFLVALTPREARQFARGCAEAIYEDAETAKAMSLDRLQHALASVAEQMDPGEQAA
jgi:hypothetical protein